MPCEALEMQMDEGSRDIVDWYGTCTQEAEVGVSLSLRQAWFT